MLLAQSSSSFCPPLNFSVPKFEKRRRTKVSSFSSYEKTNLSIKNSGKKSHFRNNYSYSNIPCRILRHPLEEELPFLEESKGKKGGIGIEKFFQGINIFITGATGLVGKALVEKLLRSTSLGKIYLLINAKDNEGALDRLEKEIIDSELFRCLKEKHGNSYDEFVREKLIPIVGNICEPNLGMDSNSARAIMEDVDVIVGSAANTTFDDRYNVLIESNVKAPQRLMRFAKTCKNLKLFVHISTAYVNGKREGLIYEKPLVMGENMRKGKDEASLYLFPRVDVTDEMNLATKLCKTSSDHDATKNLKKLGFERAAFYGWHNACQMTKAIAEMVLYETREDVPLLIIRPTIIESSFKEPFPGWIQGNRMFDPVIIAYGKGRLPAYLADPHVLVDIVPNDMVVNTTIAAIAKHGTINKEHSSVYHVATNFLNPVQLSEIFEYMHEYFTLMPLIDSESIAKIKFFKEYGEFSKYTRKEISRMIGVRNAVGTNGILRDHKLKKQYKAEVAYAEQLCKMYKYMGFINVRFHTGNTQKLLEEMSSEEKLEFEVDATNIDWRKYFIEHHITGLRKHVINNTRMGV